MIMFFMKTLAHHSFNFILLGETGTSKTSCMKSFVKNLPVEDWDVGSMIFSATTNAVQTADYVMDQLEKITMGVYGPINKRLVIMVDDLNMPVKEKYGA
jgi:dynein heavy chain, axonemal